MNVSVIIPALNEAKTITDTIASAKAALAAYPHDVVVADHGSTDGTQAAAAAAGARVVPVDGGTIGHSRNTGVAATDGDLLIFLDGDVTLPAAWAERFAVVGPELLPPDRDPADPIRVITGSRCAPPAHGSWIERHWFAYHATDVSGQHLGSAHMLIPRAFFEALGGFDETLQTGEDWDLCRRAVEAGGLVVPDPALPAVHHDYPKTLGAFVRRERWHGSGAFADPKKFLASRATTATLAFAGLHGLALALVIAGFAGVRGAFEGAVIAMIMVAVLCLVSAVLKFQHAPFWTRRVNAVLFWFYYLGRSAALTLALTRALRPGRSER